MAAPYNPPKKGEDFVIYVALEDLSNPGEFKASPTIATGDFKVKKDTGAPANLATLPAVDAAGEVALRIALSATEMDADVVCIIGRDQTTPKEWADFMLAIPTT
jgi:hypothetical protein